MKHTAILKFRESGKNESIQILVPIKYTTAKGLERVVNNCIDKMASQLINTFGINKVLEVTAENDGQKLLNYITHTNILKANI